MKRREFLLATAAVTSGVLSKSRPSEAGPCPPSTVAVTGGSKSVAQCPGSADIPAWIRSLSVGAWSTIADKPEDQIVACLPDPYPAATFVKSTTDGTRPSRTSSDPGGITSAWAGAAYDAERKEILYVANGGHGDWAGNEAYALALWADAPYWYRLTDPSPDDMMLAVYKGPPDRPSGPDDPAYPYQNLVPPDPDATNMWPFAVYMDGRSRAMHTAGHPTFAGGRVWFPVQSSITSGPGGPALAVVSYRRHHVQVIDGQTFATPIDRNARPLPHPGIRFTTDDQAAAGPWECHHPVPKSGYYGTYFTFGYSALDTSTGLIWSVGKAAGSPFYYLDTNPGPTFGQSVTAGSHSWAGDPAWFCYCADRGVFVRGSRGTLAVDVLDPSTGTWTRKQATGDGPAGDPCGTGTYYKGAIYVCAPQQTQGRIYRLQLPASLDGSWQNSWSLVPGSSTGGPQDDKGGTWNRARLVSFGSNDEYAAVVFNGGVGGGHNKPTHVFRIS